MTMRVLNIVGCGRAARTIARLWAAGGCVEVGDVLTRSPETAAAACRFIGAGRALRSLGEARPADLWLLGVSDREIGPVAVRLAAQGIVRAGDGVFHLSGFTPSAILAPLARAGAHIASVHPVLSFGDPAIAVDQFAGTLCGIEGDSMLCVELRALFAAIGAHCFPIDAERKPLYHAGSVFTSNFLVVIMDVARKAYIEAGVPPDVADGLMATLARKALDNVIATGAAAALTGPAARGDREVVEAQRRVVDAWDGPAGEAYAALSALAFRLAREQHG